MRKNEDHSFRTGDLSLAATLLSLGFSLVSLDTTDPSRVIFEFSSDAKLNEVVSAFWKGSLVVEPKTFWNTQRELKARIRSLQK